MDQTKNNIEQIFKASRLSQTDAQLTEFVTAIEQPIALVFNGVSYAVMMVTPADLDDYVRGFILSEAIIDHIDAIQSIEISAVDAGLVAHISIPQRALDHLLKRRRNLVGQASCGLCGIEDLEAALRPLPHTTKVPIIGRAAIFKALERLPSHQKLNQSTGGVHGAAFVSSSGDIVCLREDVGRHNALDKLIGALAVGGNDLSQGFLLLTSRCSFELVQKAITAGFGLMVTISVPTSLGVDIAQKHGLALISLARADTITIMNDPTGQYS